MNEDFFQNPHFDPDRYARDLEGLPASRGYVIYFTPRSGSSWLGDVIKGTGRLGDPGEWFNPAFIGNVARSINARDPVSYVEMLHRKQAPGGVFGLEITLFQLNRVFRDPARFFTLLPTDLPSFFLIREDIVAQAVSLSKAVSTGIFHTFPADDAAIERADNAYSYDAEKIRHWLEHIRSMEIRTEAFFAAFGLRPRYMLYERLVSEGVLSAVATIAHAVGVELSAPAASASPHRKLATAKSVAFAQRFCFENRQLVRSLAAERKPMIDRSRTL